MLYAKMSINICNRFLLFSGSTKTYFILAIESIILWKIHILFSLQQMIISYIITIILS